MTYKEVKNLIMVLMVILAVPVLFSCKGDEDVELVGNWVELSDFEIGRAHV